MLVIMASLMISWVSRKACSFHCATSVGKYDSYFVRAEMIVILASSGATFGRKRWALNSTQPSAALVMIKVLPASIESVRILIGE